jgi:methyltransferase family protein
VTARRGPARHAAARVLPARRRDQDDRDPLAALEPPADLHYEPDGPPRYEPDRPPPAAQRSPEREPGPDPQQAREAWLRRGHLPFDYLIKQGLQPGDRLLEIGCGDLAAGHLFIDYLSAGNYYGIDLSPDAVIGANQTITEFGLQAKAPHVTLVGDLTLGFLPTSRFTVVQADGVFSHSPIEMIGECMAHVTRVMTADAIFDFTFDQTAGAERQAPGTRFRYRPDTLIDLAASHGLDAELMQDWRQPGSPQSKLRVTRAN